MATVVMMRNPQTGIIKKGFVGFSWTTLFFGGFPALFRGDWLMGAILLFLGIVTFGVSGLIAAFIYNKTYTTKLVENGYQFADSEALNALARAKLGVSMVDPVPSVT
ncbi:hypothetical protein [Azospirillum doebereinerae]|uniref:HrgC protein n=1 Tax=Azospirillum doebereinerae TaxID=92933 RepID=A0A433JDN8_9PROT|nr:hypothetical protein [Azospirillum doebereinerae]RUQ75015.1 hypothetical protein EJ913_03905 [Azospirillum doebereinerae]